MDDLTCSIDVESTDIDGDALTYVYTWYDQDGNWADETLATSDLTNVYPGTGTDVGSWTCEVVANDGETDSTNCIASIVEDCYDGLDNDLDGLVDCDDLDCVNESGCVGSVEICDDGQDNDLDGLVDCDDSTCANELVCGGTGSDICLGGIGVAVYDVDTLEPSWTEIWSHPLSSLPSGASYSDGAWNGQAVRNYAGRNCWRMESDWNYFFIPVTRSTTNYEKIQIDLYHANNSGDDGSRFNFMANKTGWNSISNWMGMYVNNSSDLGFDYRTTSHVILTESTYSMAAQWRTLSVVVDKDLAEATYYIDGNEITVESIPTAVLSSTGVSLHAGDGQGSWTSPSTCWSNLKVYEGQ